MKYSKKLSKKIVELYESGKYSIEDICEKVGIHHSTFFEWKKTKSEFSESLEEVEERRLEFIRDAAVSGLMKLVKGFDYEEVKTDYVSGKDPKTGKEIAKVKAVTRTKKHVQPNPKMVEYALNNLHPDKFKTSSKIDHTNNGESFNFGNFLMDTDDEDDEDLGDGTPELNDIPLDEPPQPAPSNWLV